MMRALVMCMREHSEQGNNTVQSSSPEVETEISILKKAFSGIVL